MLDATLPDWEIIVVDDGSRDGTFLLAQAYSYTDCRIRVVQHSANQGYGAAWRSGFATAVGEYIMCMDSDGQFDLSDITRLLPYVNHSDAVVGYRIDRQDPLYRKVNTAIFHWAVRVMFGVKLRDLDCAFKIFHGKFIHALPLRSSGALINLEIFSFARRKNATVVEVGVRHYPRLAGEPTGAKPAVVLRAMFEILWLRYRVWRCELIHPGTLRVILPIGVGVALAGALQWYLGKRR